MSDFTIGRVAPAQGARCGHVRECTVKLSDIPDIVHELAELRAVEQAARAYLCRKDVVRLEPLEIKAALASLDAWRRLR